MIRFLIYTLVCIPFFANAQEDKTRYTSNQLEAGFNYEIDTIIDGTAYFKKKSNAAIITSEKAPRLDALKDNLIAKNFEDKWLNELYNNTLFEGLNTAISTLEYQPIKYPNLPTDTLKERLKKLDAKTPINITYNSALESVIKSFLSKRREALTRLMSLSYYYFPMFERELDLANIPLEIKYLAIIESALNPKAKSRVGATGLWQFMFATGKQYGLEVNSYVDERCNPLLATKAAAEYLAKLHEIFNDWDLALAAYNSGPGNVNKAIRRSGGYTNFWNIRKNLPRETAGYVPAFLATLYIFEYAKEHGFAIEKPQYHHIETDTILIKNTITLEQVSKITKVPLAALQFLNPSYKLDIIPFISEKKYSLRLPRSAVGVFVSNEKQIYKAVAAELNQREKPLPKLEDAKSQERYTVKSGDYLGKIAQQYGVRISQLKRWNGLKGTALKIGQKLVVYPENPKFSNTNKKAIPKKVKTYKVQAGDSLWSISQKISGVSVQNLKDWNNISGTNLKPGMLLIISKS